MTQLFYFGCERANVFEVSISTSGSKQTSEEDEEQGNALKINLFPEPNLLIIGRICLSLVALFLRNYLSYGNEILQGAST